MMAVFSQRYEPRGTLRVNEPMSKHTSWRTGGPADLYFAPADREDLVGFLSHLAIDIEILWIGLGSNLLVRDNGIRGVVIATHKCFGNIEIQAPNRVFVESGVPGAKVARFSVRNDLAGAEFFAGIPGTFGGALAMNAGAYGCETWDIVSQVEIIDRLGEIRKMSPMEFRVDYRQVDMPKDTWFLSGTIVLKPGNTETGRIKIKRNLSQRADTQPVQEPNAGSVFRNPTGDFAARLIEACGLKGLRVGNASVSTLHGNFIVNEGNATSSDIEELISHVQAVVQKKEGVELKREVRIVGEPE